MIGIYFSLIIFAIVLFAKADELIDGSSGEITLKKIISQPVRPCDVRAINFLIFVGSVCALGGAYSIVNFGISIISWLSFVSDLAKLILFYLSIFNYFVRKKILINCNSEDKQGIFKPYDVWALKKYPPMKSQDASLLYISNLALGVNIVVIIAVHLLK